jgi:hypothetical protein
VIKVQFEAYSIADLKAQMQRLLEGQEPAAAAVALALEPMAPPTTQAIPEPAEGNEQGEPEPAPKTRRARKPQPAVADADKTSDLNREDIVKGLTDIYMTSPPAVRARITQFRDAAGANRLRDLDDDVLPEAAKLLAELKEIPAAS